MAVDQQKDEPTFNNPTWWFILALGGRSDSEQFSFSANCICWSSCFESKKNSTREEDDNPCRTYFVGLCPQLLSQNGFCLVPPLDPRRRQSQQCEAPDIKTETLSSTIASFFHSANTSAATNPLVGLNKQFVLKVLRKDLDQTGEIPSVFE